MSTFQQKSCGNTKVENLIGLVIAHRKFDHPINTSTEVEMSRNLKTKKSDMDYFKDMKIIKNYSNTGTLNIYFVHTSTAQIHKF